MSRFWWPWVAVLASCGTGAVRTDTFPPDPPSQQAYERVKGGVQVTWRNPRDADFATTMLARITTRTDKPISKPPESGKTPRAGDPFGSAGTQGAGVVLWVGASPSFLDTTAPDKCTPFVYQLFSQDKAGNWSVGPAQLDVVPRSSAALTAPTGLTAATIEGDVRLAWINPPVETGYTELRVVRKEGSAPLTPTDGVAIFSGTSSATAEPLSGLGAASWTYGVFACDGCGLCTNSPATVAFSRAPADAGTDAGIPDGGLAPDAGTELLTPTNLAAQLSGDGKNVVLSWTNPPKVTSVRVLRTLNTAAIGPGDSSATVVFSGAGATASEPTDKLAPEVSGMPQLWHYRVYGCKNASCESVGAATTLKLTVAQALRGGGYTLFWRHATATVCGDQTQLGPANNTTQPNWWKSCDRNCLTATARQIDNVQAPNETATIHTAFAARGFVIGKVLSSEFCRALETAQGMNFGPVIESSEVLSYYVYDEAQRCPNTMALLNTAPAGGTNSAHISHAGFTCPIIDSLAWGEAAIYKPQASGGARFITRVLWNGWTALP